MTILNTEPYFSIGHDIIGAAFEVRKKTGSGLREKFYEKALVFELLKKGHHIEEQVTIPALYEDMIIDEAYIADIIVDNLIIVEVKAVGSMSEKESRQLLTYLKLSNFKLGYLINFGAQDFSLGKLSEHIPYKKGIYRMVNNF